AGGQMVRSRLGCSNYECPRCPSLSCRTSLPVNGEREAAATPATSAPLPVSIPIGFTHLSLAAKSQEHQLLNGGRCRHDSTGALCRQALKMLAFLASHPSAKTDV